MSKACVPDTVTVPAVPENTPTDEPQAELAEPELVVQLVADPSQVPEPPSTVPLAVVLDPSQNWIDWPPPVTVRLTWPEVVDLSMVPAAPATPVAVTVSKAPESVPP